MEMFFAVYLVVIILLTLLMLIRLFRGPGIYNRFAGVTVMSTNVILILILLGYVDGRTDMYIDIAVSYAVLGFISSVILAKFLGGKGGNDNGN
jgi:multicomponent Na+:H+ antiporter subunit F